VELILYVSSQSPRSHRGRAQHQAGARALPHVESQADGVRSCGIRTPASRTRSRSRRRW
jgi:hypothetical protein